MSSTSPRVVLAIWQAVDAFHQALNAAGELVIAPTSRDEDVAPLMAGADVLVTGRFSRAMGDAAGKLRLIQTPGAGLNGIDFSAVPEDVAVCNVYGHERGIAEYAFMTMAALNRDLFGLDRRLRIGDWRDYLGGPLRELQGRTVAIVGLGRIGAEIARWAAFLKMRAIAVTRTPDPVKRETLGLARIAGMDQLHAVLGEADFVVLAVPLDTRTRGLIGRDELAAMKRSA
ncbi:MAG: hypothetical protein IT336_13730, partial [Thermomicrobiales bacterium]|nr:hypothetical protein [Thermomicrobiales bacterium]